MVDGDGPAPAAAPEYGTVGPGVRVVDEVLFGRESEQARLTGQLDRAPATGGALVLRGEAGVGKSSLLAATTSQAARRGMRILTTTGVQAEIEVPFAGLHRLLRTVLDGEREPAARDTVLAAVGMVDAPVGQPFRVALAVLDLLTTTTAAAGQPVLLAVEDAQWLDRPSWDVLTFVARRLTSDPVVLVMAMRDGAECERRLASAGLPELRVEPLAEEPAVALLAYRAPGLSPALRARVLSEAGGNPLGLVELAVVAARFGPDALLPASLPLTARVERTFTALVGEAAPGDQDAAAGRRARRRGRPGRDPGRDRRAGDHAGHGCRRPGGGHRRPGRGGRRVPDPVPAPAGPLRGTPGGRGRPATAGARRARPASSPGRTTAGSGTGPPPRSGPTSRWRGTSPPPPTGPPAGARSPPR